MIVPDHEFTHEGVLATVMPILAEEAALQRMKEAAAGLGKNDAAEQMAEAMMTLSQKESQ